MQLSDDFLRRAADTLLTLDYTAWNFGDSIAFEAMIAASDALGDDRWTSFAYGFVRAWATRRRPFKRLDCTAPGLAMVELHKRTDDTVVLEAAVDLARYLMARPRIGELFATWEHSPLQRPYGPIELVPSEAALLVDPPRGAFIDCLHFDPPFLVALGVYVGDNGMVDEGTRQARAYVDQLQTAAGLFDHFLLEGRARTYGPGWGRGQGWALLGLLDVLAWLPPDHAARDGFVQVVNSMVTAMVRLQREDGHWYTVVDDPASGDETSTAAFMADGCLRATELGIVDESVTAASQRAIDAVLANTDDQGVLRGVSAAVNACTHPGHYAHVPRGFLVPWGQGPLVTSLARHLRAKE